MNEKKFQFFVSSTYEDLKEAREKVIETILRNYHIPIGMEMFSARDEEQWEIIKETIDDSDYYIVIIGHRYGSMTPDGISYTEKEYDYAKSKDIPILAFIKDRDAPTKPKQRDDDPEKIKKLDKFIKKVSGKMRETWSNTDDLANRITTAVHKAIKRYPCIGWIKANNAISPQVSEELAKLSKENRELKTRLSNIEQLKPRLDVLLNGGKELEFKFKRLELKKKIYEPIVYDKVPDHLREYVTEDKILEFNKQVVKRKKEIDLYKKELLRYWRIKLQPEKFVVEVINDGNAKANEVYIEIKFPEGLIILDRERRDNIARPKPIEGLEDPLEKAEKDFQEKKERESWH